MTAWEKFQIGEFVFEREGKYKPHHEAIVGLQRIDKIDFDGNFHLSGKPSKTGMILIKPRDLVISGINVSKGALGVYQGDEDVSATIHYSSYTFDEKKIDVDYFRYFVKSESFLDLLEKQVGGGIKTEIKPRHFLSLTISLPNKSEQEEIVKKFRRIEKEYAKLQIAIEQQRALVSNLRQMILDMAVRGKLVPQNPKSEPAAVLLEKIKAERQKQERAGKVSANPLPSLTDEEKSFTIPVGWEWARLGEVLIYDAGINVTPGQLKGEKWLLELEDIEKNTSRLLQKIKVKERSAKSHKSEFMKGDVLYGKLRPYLNKALVASEDGYSTTEIVSLRPYCDIVPEYAVVCLKRSDFHAYVEQSGQGTKMPRLRKVDAIKASFPLPPLAEQKRIVTKVNKLMALCDKLEAQITDNQNNTNELVKAISRETFPNA